jgi:hypothetical protein
MAALKDRHLFLTPLVLLAVVAVRVLVRVEQQADPAAVVVAILQARRVMPELQDKEILAVMVLAAQTPVALAAVVVAVALAEILQQRALAALAAPD